VLGDGNTKSITKLATGPRKFAICPAAPRILEHIFRTLIAVVAAFETDNASFDVVFTRSDYVLVKVDSDDAWYLVTSFVLDSVF
jgi:hypothetical protein